MIFDKITNYGFYRFPLEWACVLKFLQTAHTLETGRYELENGIYATVMEYNTLFRDECRIEKHRKYIDLQYTIEGEEKIGITFFGTPVTAYDAEKDIEFFSGSTDEITIKPGSFILFFPHDMHKVKIGNGGTVKKAVVKIPLALYERA